MEKILKKQATTMKSVNIALPKRENVHSQATGRIGDMLGTEMILAARNAIYESSRVRENWETWVEALESGDYEQDADGGVLNRNVGKGESTWCCLGVACDLQDVSWTKDDGNGVYLYVDKEDGTSRDCLPDPYLMNDSFGVIRQEISLDNWDEGNDIYLIAKFYENGKYHTGLVTGSAANDDGVSFATIAQAIRNTYLNPVYERMGLQHMMVP